MTSKVHVGQFASHLIVNMVADTSESEPVDVRQHGHLQVTVPTGWAPAAIGVKTSPITNSTFYPVYVSRQINSVTGGQPVELLVPYSFNSVAAGRALVFDVSGMGFVRLWSHTGGATAVTQTYGLPFSAVKKW